MKNQEITKIENKVENAMSEDIKYRIEAAMAGAKYASRCDIYFSQEEKKVFFFFTDENGSAIFFDAIEDVEDYDEAVEMAGKWCMDICEGELPVDEDGVNWDTYTRTGDWALSADELYYAVSNGESKQICCRDVIEKCMTNHVIEKIEAKVDEARDDIESLLSYKKFYVVHEKSSDGVIILYADEDGEIIGADSNSIIDCNDGYFEKCIPDIIHDIYISLDRNDFHFGEEEAKEIYNELYNDDGKLKDDRYEFINNIYDYIGIEYLPELDS